MKLKREDFYQLPSKDKIQSMVKPNWVKLSRVIEEQYGISRNGAYVRKSMGDGDINVKIVDDRIYIDLNNYSTQERHDINNQRVYVLDRMFESIYFNLDLFLNDFQKAKLFAELTGSSTQSWVQWFVYFKPMLNSNSGKLSNFIKYGLRILKTNALYRNFEKRW